MDSQNIFDLFGRQKKQEIDTKILNFKSEFSNGINLFKDHVRKN